eukprot:SAG31_NODE_27786_length_420_cov_0.800623_2_plen_36_part_01
MRTDMFKSSVVQRWTIFNFSVVQRWTTEKLKIDLHA